MCRPLAGIGAIVLVWFISSSGGRCQEKAGARDIDEFRLLLSNYTANRAGFDKYAVAFACERTFEDFENPVNCSTVNIWFIQCIDQKNNRRRYDSSNLGYSIKKNVFITAYSTTFCNKNKFQSFESGELFSSDDLDSPQFAQGQVKNITVSAVRFDPWDLPLAGEVTFQARSEVSIHLRFNSNYAGIESKWGSNLNALRSTATKHFAEFTLNEEHGVFEEVTFDRTQSELPVLSNIGFRGNRWNGIMASVKTEWLAVSADRRHWIPSVVTINHVGGNPKKPISKTEWRMESHWLFDNDIVDPIFSTDPLMSTVELKDLILDHSITQELRDNAKKKGK